MIRRPAYTGFLVCAECAKSTDGKARGWRAFLIGGLDGEPLGVVGALPGLLRAGAARVEGGPG